MQSQIIRSTLAFAMAAVALSVGAATELSSEEVMALVKDKRIRAKHADHFGPFDLDFRSNGSLFGSVEGRSDSGTWEVKDAKLCIKWRKWIYDGCGVVQRGDGDTVQHLWPDGRIHFVAPGK